MPQALRGIGSLLAGLAGLGSFRLTGRVRTEPVLPGSPSEVAALVSRRMRELGYETTLKSGPRSIRVLCEVTGGGQFTLVLTRDESGPVPRVSTRVRIEWDGTSNDRLSRTVVSALKHPGR
jgi:hypothetical protein